MITRPTFITSSDDGVRLWVDGKKLIDNWTDYRQKDDEGIIRLEAGNKHSIRMEYYQLWG